MTGIHYTPAEESFLRSKISTMLQYGYGVDKITEALKIPRATVADRIKKLRMEAMSRSEDYYQSLPLELEHALGNLGTVWMMALTLYRDPQARMSYASRVNLLSTLKTIVESRIDILSNVSIIKDIATYTEQQRIRIEKLQKQS